MDTLDALRLFVSISEAGNLTAAAHRQSVAVSTVASALQQLEELTGARLITRTTRRLTFTHEGDRFLAEARRLLIDWDGAIDSVRPGAVVSGPIRITATNDFGRLRLLQALDRFMALHPDVRITVQLGDGVVDLVEHNIDLALRNGPLADSSYRSRLLVRSNRVVCASPAYWNARGKPAHPEQLAAHNCLILHRTGVPFAVWPFVIDGQTLSVRVGGDRTANDGSVLRYWALQGHGVMIKNHWEVRREIEAGQLETALDEYSTRAVNLYAVTADTPNRRVSILIDFLAEDLRNEH